MLSGFTSTEREPVHSEVPDYCEVVRTYVGEVDTLRCRLTGPHSHGACRRKQEHRIVLLREK
ncbi:hypothetical protein EYF80_064967 [Liparis tanakae]|uniref:Uncharacterized protein n=1 Tax=Liparis tanakae TaxID=230148 RepID=A0A4Z2E7Y2_9TELE|nr:hypothetical protein EYF80_064967 [Liparis tanakae]